MTTALKEALKDNNDLLNEVEAYESSATENAGKVQGLERDLKTAIDKRQDLKELIRKTTGLSELSEDALSKLGQGDEALKSEVGTLQEKLEAVMAERDGLNGKHTQEINTMKMTDHLRSMGVDSQVWNQSAFEAVAQKMLEGAEYDGGSFVYKADDGATVFGDNGKALTVKERIAQLREDESMYQFKPVQGAGAGGTDKKPFGQGGALKGEALAQAKADYITTHGTLKGFTQPQ